MDRSRGGHRFYSAAQSRWVSRDPAGPVASNPYLFLANGVPNKFDALGLRDVPGGFDPHGGRLEPPYEPPENPQNVYGDGTLTCRIVGAIVDQLVRPFLDDNQYAFYKKWRDSANPEPPYDWLKGQVEATDQYTTAKEALDYKLGQTCEDDETGTDEEKMDFLQHMQLTFVLKTCRLKQDWECDSDNCTARKRLYTYDVYDFKPMDYHDEVKDPWPFAWMEENGCGHPYTITVDHNGSDDE